MYPPMYRHGVNTTLCKTRIKYKDCGNTLSKHRVIAQRVKLDTECNCFWSFNFDTCGCNCGCLCGYREWVCLCVGVFVWMCVWLDDPLLCVYGWRLYWCVTCVLHFLLPETFSFGSKRLMKLRAHNLLLSLNSQGDRYNDQPLLRLRMISANLQ